MPHETTTPAATRYACHECHLGDRLAVWIEPEGRVMLRTETLGSSRSGTAELDAADLEWLGRAVRGEVAMQEAQ